MESERACAATDLEIRDGRACGGEGQRRGRQAIADSGGRCRGHRRPRHRHAIGVAHGIRARECKVDLLGCRARGTGRGNQGEQDDQAHQLAGTVVCTKKLHCECVT